MPAGLPYFAWIEPTEDAFGPEHMRWDESVFSFDLKQSEGDPASLTVVVRRPRNEEGRRIGLLGPDRKIWAWFALDCGPGLFRFRGRLVGVPTSILEELVTLEFVARPFDVVEQKEALAETLRVLPYYDEAVIEPARRDDPEVVLEGYTKIWHYDRESHIITVSDEIVGEDGTLGFDGESVDGKVLYDGLGLTLTTGPLSRVDVAAEYTWTQLARGDLDLTGYLAKQMGGSGRTIISYTFTADDWVKTGTALGDGWVAKEASADPVYDTSPKTRSSSSELIVIWGGDEGKTTVKRSETETYLSPVPPGTIPVGGGTSKYEDKVTYSIDGEGRSYPSSFNASWEQTHLMAVAHHTKASLIAGYDAQRPCTERISFSMYADVQSILTDPEDGEALRLTDIKSVNLSEPLSGITGTEIPIGDARRRSYIATTRGLQSFEHLLALARTTLMKRARVVEIKVTPKLSRMPEITLRKNVLVVEPRIGEALGKIVGYSISLDGSDGRINCSVSIGCAIGRGGSVVGVDGEPTYCSIEYAGADYQQFVGRTVLFDGDNTTVGYEPPIAAPNDDGINFLSALTAKDVIDQPLVVDNPPGAQAAMLAGMAIGGGFGVVDQEFISELTSHFNNTLRAMPTRWTFKLKSMTREFSSDYSVNVTTLQIPLGYDLEAV
jgi:hypothetical protein